MSNSKPLLPFTFDFLCYLNRNQLERFSIVCRHLKNLIDWYFHSLFIRGGSYYLFHNHVQWHPSRDDYTAQQFLDDRKCNIVRPWNDPAYYLFAEMRPYLGATVRIKWTSISVAGSITYNVERVAEMESIAYLWCGGKISIAHANIKSNRCICAEDLHLVLNSPTILQCQTLTMYNAHFSFKDYKVLYAVKVIKTSHYNEDQIDLWHQYWQQFLEEPGVKPIVGFRVPRLEVIDKLLNRLCHAFSCAVSPNSFKIVFVQYGKPLTEFKEKNSMSGEILELKKGFPVGYQDELSSVYHNYTFERYCV